MRTMHKPFILSVLALLSACQRPAANIDEIAREYLHLELSMGVHDTAHVDAYFGPEDLRTAAAAAGLTLDQIRAASTDLAARLKLVDPGQDEMRRLRIAGLLARLRSLDMRIAINQGDEPDFDDESMALFGARAPDYDAAHFEAILARLEALLPGDGPLSTRVETFNDQFAIPPDKLQAVFDAAIAECRRRTLAHIELPPGESFTIEFVNDKPWSGYNWYQGNGISLIQINTDFPIYISRAVDLGCHEGYPGHHTFNALLEKRLVDEAGWVEYSLYPLFSPQSLIAEGSANYGVELAFPGDERVRFEKSILFPLAGLDASNANLYYEIGELIEQLDFAKNEAARDYLNGTITRDQAAEWLQSYAMMRADKSMQRTEFFDAYRSYVINYNHGKALVANYVERDAATVGERWVRFAKLLSSPLLPSDLQ